MPRIFLSYRRADAAGHARRLHDALAAQFGDDSVFTDVERIPSGTHFVDSIRDLVSSADVFLAIIGPHWLEPDASGRRRIDDPNDHVRAEIEAALARGLRVVPVLVAGATMPGSDELPASLRGLLMRKELVLTDANWELDVARAVRAFEPVAAEVTAPSPEPPPAAGAPPPPPPPPVAPSETSELEVRLRGKLRDAALAGVVPAGVPAAYSPTPPPQYVPAPSAPVPEPRSAPKPYPMERMRAGPGRLLRVVLPLALVGAGVVVAAKWLLGWFATDVEVPERPGDEVVCTVFAPPAAAPGDSLLVQVFAHLPEQARDALAIATELDIDARRRTFESLGVPVPTGARLDFELRMPGLEVDEPVASLIWRRRTEAVQFGVNVPPTASPGTVIGTLEISLDSAPVGQVKFKLSVDAGAGEPQSEPQGETARRYTVAFISYASEDREQVLSRVQVLSLVGVRYFQDVLSLEPGDRWEQRLKLGIDECDLFLLFWSSDAKRSEWVRKEVQYALARSGGSELSSPEIRPVILEGPPIVEPWEELAHLHFNDRLIYFMRAPGEG
jgi:hypothetical protein